MRDLNARTSLSTRPLHSETDAGVAVSGQQKSRQANNSPCSFGFSFAGLKLYDTGIAPNLPDTFDYSMTKIPRRVHEHVYHEYVGSMIYALEI